MTKDTSKSEQSTARELSQALSGSPSQHKEETKTITLTFAPRAPAEVVFTGQWSGRLIRSALNAISRGYRRRKYKQIRPGKMVDATKVVKPKGGVGDGSV